MQNYFNDGPVDAGSQYGIRDVIWTPITGVLMGAEFQYGRHVNFSDNSTFDDYHLQFSFNQIQLLTTHRRASPELLSRHLCATVGETAVPLFGLPKL